MKPFQLLLVTCTIAVLADAKNPMETPGLVDGDIQVSPEEFIALKEGKLTFGSIRGGRWTKGEIPYVISTNMRASGRQRIQEAINEYHAKTCLRFKKRTNERYYIYFQEGTGCNSPVGMTSYGNTINLEYPGCHSKGTVMHEIGHSIGLYHEQNRPDRDQFVRIHLNNINGPWAYAFKIVNSIDSLGTPYDLHSMMHYSSTAFAYSGRKTITTIDPSKQSIIDTYNMISGFSTIDVKQINLMYKDECAKRGDGGNGGGNGGNGGSGGSGGSCADKDNRCSGWKTYCGKNQYVDTNCKKTCGTCPGGNSGCQDKHTGCANYKRMGYCTTQHVQWMKENCCKTCGY